MQHATWHPPDIPGISFEATIFHDDNPGCGDEPHPRLCVGWLEVIIRNNGKNPFYPRSGHYAYTFIRLTEGAPVTFKGTKGVKYVPLEDGEQVLEGFIEEDAQEVPTYGTIFGLWLRFVVRTRAGGTRQVRTLITRMQNMAPA